MSRWLVTIGTSAAFAVGGWIVGHADELPLPGMGHPPGIHAPGQRETIQGQVIEQTKAPTGEIDGVILEDGTWLHWPPHLEKYLGKLTQPGQVVEAEGRRQAGPRGEIVVEVFSLTNVEANATFEREEMPPPPPRRIPCPPHAPHAGPPPFPGANHPGMPREGMQPPPPVGHIPPEEKLQRIEDRLKKIEEQLGKLVDHDT